MGINTFLIITLVIYTTTFNKVLSEDDPSANANCLTCLEENFTKEELKTPLNFIKRMFTHTNKREILRNYRSVLAYYEFLILKIYFKSRTGFIFQNPEAFCVVYSQSPDTTSEEQCMGALTGYHKLDANSGMRNLLYFAYNVSLSDVNPLDDINNLPILAETLVKTLDDINVKYDIITTNNAPFEDNGEPTLLTSCPIRSFVTWAYYEKAVIFIETHYYDEEEYYYKFYCRNIYTQDNTKNTEVNTEGNTEVNIEDNIENEN